MPICPVVEGLHYTGADVPQIRAELHQVLQARVQLMCERRQTMMETVREKQPVGKLKGEGVRIQPPPSMGLLHLPGHLP